MDGVGTKVENYVAKLLRAAQSGSESEQIGLAPEPEPFHQLSHWSRAVSGPSRAVTTLVKTTQSTGKNLYDDDTGLIDSIIA